MWPKLWGGLWGEDRVGSDPPLNDMSLAGEAFSAVAESRAAVIVQGDHEYARVGGHALDTQLGRNGRSGRPRRSL